MHFHTPLQLHAESISSSNGDFYEELLRDKNDGDFNEGKSTDCLLFKLNS